MNKYLYADADVVKVPKIISSRLVLFIPAAASTLNNIPIDKVESKPPPTKVAPSILTHGSGKFPFMVSAPVIINPQVVEVN